MPFLLPCVIWKDQQKDEANMLYNSDVKIENLHLDINKNYKHFLMPDMKVWLFKFCFYHHF